MRDELARNVPQSSHPGNCLTLQQYRAEKENYLTLEQLRREIQFRPITHGDDNVTATVLRRELDARPCVTIQQIQRELDARPCRASTVIAPGQVTQMPGPVIVPGQVTQIPGPYPYYPQGGIWDMVVNRVRFRVRYPAQPGDEYGNVLVSGNNEMQVAACLGNDPGRYQQEIINGRKYYRIPRGDPPHWPWSVLHWNLIQILEDLGAVDPIRGTAKGGRWEWATLSDNILNIAHALFEGVKTV